MRNSLSRHLVQALLALIFALTLAAPPHLPAQQQQPNRDSIATYVNSVGKLIYNLAWPTATYRDVSIGSFQLQPGGFDVGIRLNGISAFDNDALWLELVLQVRNGAFYDMKLGRNNAILMQPFATVSAFGAATAMLAKQYAAQHPQQATPSAPPVNSPPQPAAQPPQTPATPPYGILAGAVCIGNPTASDMTLQYQWGQGQWEPITISSNGRMKLWWNYQDATRTSPDLVIRYTDPLNPNTQHTYNLPRKQAKVPFECADVANYNFELSSDRTALLVTHP